MPASSITARIYLQPLTGLFMLADLHDALPDGESAWRQQEEPKGCPHGGPFQLGNDSTDIALFPEVLLHSDRFQEQAVVTKPLQLWNRSSSSCNSWLFGLQTPLPRLALLAAGMQLAHGQAPLCLVSAVGQTGAKCKLQGHVLPILTINTT